MKVNDPKDVYCGMWDGVNIRATERFDTIPSIGIFHKLPSVASVLSCSEINRDFQSEQKTLTVQL